jgi:hypothetical protein
MVHVTIGRDPLLKRRFTEGERWCWVAGILATAADSPIRGWLFLTERVAATAADIADIAGVREKTAEKTLEKAIKFGLVAHDETVDCLFVPGFDRYNPPPKRDDKTNADRQKRYRERVRNAESNAVTNAVTETPVTPGREEKGREENVEPKGSTNKAEHPDFAAWLSHHNAITGQSIPREGTAHRAEVASMYAARRSERYTAEDLCLATVGAFNDSYRRENGHYGCISVLRPKKVHDLIEKGRRPKPVALAQEHPTSRRIREIQELRERLRAEEEAAA